MRVPQLSSSGLVADHGKMPPDKKTTPGRPLLPTLSAPNKSAKTPLTPRIAGISTPASSPLIRRGISNDSCHTPREGSDEVVTSHGLFNSNVTPRSSARKAKIDSTTSTPTGTPTITPSNTRPNSHIGHPTIGNASVGSSGLGINLTDSAAVGRPKSLVGDGQGSNLGYVQAVPTLSRPVNNVDKQGLSPKFFHASDVKSPSISKPTQQRNSMHSKKPSFFYANGELHRPSNTSSELESITNVNDQEKLGFVHADGSPDIDQDDRPRYLTGPPRTSTEPDTDHSNEPTSNQDLSGSSSTFQHGLSESKKVTSPRFTSGKPSLGSSSGKSSGDSHIPSISYSTNTSIGSRESLGLGQISNDNNLPEDGHSTNIHELDPTLSGCSSNNVDLDEATSTLETPGSPDIPPPSPTKSKSGSSKLQQMNELAANARRERKVLDLEITNSSLLAINRTLEREMRKQNTELRRYRRLSRAGRLSITSSIRSSVDRMSTVSEDEDDSGLSDEGGMEDSDCEDREEDMSEAALAESDARHRAEDERRLELDLSKHRQLLVDSQKMNQSLKRCLGLTEELISEARKAIDYQVRVSDVELGGRVLSPDEVEGREGESYIDQPAAAPDSDILEPPYSEKSTDEAMGTDFQDLGLGNDESVDAPSVLGETY